MSTSTARIHHRMDDDPARGFGSPRDFLEAVLRDRDARHRDQVSDHRLRALSASNGLEFAFLLPQAFTPTTIRAAAGSDEMGSYSDPYGGFAVHAPTVTGFALGAVEGDPTAGRTLALPMGTPELHVLARTDKDHSTSVTGGLRVTRTPETLPRASTRMQMEAVSLKATSLFGFSWATDELVTANAGAFVAILAAAYRDEFATTMLREKIRGGGGNEYLGVLNSPAKLTIAAEGGQSAATINAANVMNMTRQAWGYERAIWLANPETRPQLTQAVLVVEGTNGGGIIQLFQPATREGEPDMLDGRPVFFTEHCSALGTEGDLILSDWSQYLEGTYQPLQGAESVHVRWEEHETAFKFWTRNAGAPWWRSPLTPTNGTRTLSPIVTLATRAGS